MQTSAVPVVQLRGAKSTAIDAHFQYPGIRSSEHVGADRTTFEFQRHLIACLFDAKKFHPHERTAKAAGDFFPVRFVPIPTLATLGQAGREESSIKKTGGIDRLDR